MTTIERRFSADLTAVTTLADTGVLQLLHLATVGQQVSLRYKSPWRQSEGRDHVGLIERVHLSDGLVYVLFRTQAGRRMVLNAPFIRDVQPLSEPIAMAEPTETEVDLAWLDGFGVWSGEVLTSAREGAKGVRVDRQRQHRGTPHARVTCSSKQRTW